MDTKFITNQDVILSELISAVGAACKKTCQSYAPCTFD
jgi:hypothetical protein